MIQQSNTENKQNPAQQSEPDFMREAIKRALEKYGIPSRIELFR